MHERYQKSQHNKVFRNTIQIVTLLGTILFVCLPSQANFEALSSIHVLSVSDEKIDPVRKQSNSIKHTVLPEFCVVKRKTKALKTNPKYLRFAQLATQFQWCLNEKHFSA